MKNLQNGFIAGLLAGLVLAMLNFVNDGTPGRTLPQATAWFGLHISNSIANRLVGFLLLLILGGIFGLIYGVLQRGRLVSIGRALTTGLAIGVVWWLIFVLLLSSIRQHALPFGPTFYTFLGFFLFILPYLFYGLALGALYFQRQRRSEGTIV